MEGIMIKKILISICIALCLQSICFGEADNGASKDADTFRSGIKLIELSEGKQMLRDTAWFPESKYPVFTEVTTLFEGMFPTDNPKIQGYKRLIEVKAVSEAKTPLMQKYLLISYKDRNSNRWKVFEFRESYDTEHGAQEMCSHGTAGQCAYWSALAGKLSQALESEIKDVEIEDKKPEKEKNHMREFRASRGVPQPERYLEVLKKIIGD